MIPIDLLIEFGAVTRHYKKDTFILREGAIAKFYYQVVNGKVKMYNISDDGQEFIQGIFLDGNSFAEPPLFLDSTYPASAKTIFDSEIAILEKAKLMLLLQKHFDVQLQLLQALSSRLYFKAMMSKEITLHHAAHRIITLIDFLKKRDKFTNGAYPVVLTRQQIADLTGLRVETVIRTMKHLVEIKKLQQKGTKIYR